jgi:hypothetical protein
MTPPQNGRCWIGFEDEIAQCIENQYEGSEDTGLLRGSDKISVVQLDVDSAFENVTNYQAANGQKNESIWSTIIHANCPSSRLSYYRIYFHLILKISTATKI